MGFDTVFLLIAMAAALALMFAVGSYTSLDLVSNAMDGVPHEGSRGFTANFGLFVSSVLSVLVGGIATVYLLTLFVWRVGSALCWQRVVGYVLLSPYAVLLLRILWVQLFR